jgi:hypothetical protein
MGVALSAPVAVPRYTLYDFAPALAVHFNFTRPLPGVAVSPAGAGAGPTWGFALASLDKPLVPTAFTAATLKKYVLPFVKPVFVKDVVVIPVAIGVAPSDPAVRPR